MNSATETKLEKEKLSMLDQMFVNIDQPRGYKGFIAKALVNGAIGAVGAGAVYGTYNALKRRKERLSSTSKPLSLQKNA